MQRCVEGQTIVEGRWEQQPMFRTRMCGIMTLTQVIRLAVRKDISISRKVSSRSARILYGNVTARRWRLFWIYVIGQFRAQTLLSLEWVSQELAPPTLFLLRSDRSSSYALSLGSTTGLRLCTDRLVCPDRLTKPMYQLIPPVTHNVVRASCYFETSHLGR